MPCLPLLSWPRPQDVLEVWGRFCPKSWLGNGAAVPGLRWGHEARGAEPCVPPGLQPHKGKGWVQTWRGGCKTPPVVPASLPTPKSQAVLTSRPHQAQLGSALQQWIPNPKSPAPGAHGGGKGTAHILLTASRMTSPQAPSCKMLSLSWAQGTETPALPLLYPLCLVGSGQIKALKAQKTPFLSPPAIIMVC